MRVRNQKEVASSDARVLLQQRWLTKLMLTLACFATAGCASLGAEQIRLDNSALIVNGDAIVKGELLIGRGAAVHFNGSLNEGSHAFPVTNQGLLQFGGQRPQRVTGALGGQGVLRIAAPAEVTLTSDNGFDGAIQIERGALLRISGTLGCGVYSGVIVNDGVLAFSPSAKQTLAGGLVGSGELRLEGGTLVLGQAPGTPLQSSCARQLRPSPRFNRYPDMFLP